MTDETASAPIPAAPRFVDETGRRETVPLLWPLEYDGRVWSEIAVRRLTVAEVRAWSAKVIAAQRAGEDTSAMTVPVFDAPEAVLSALDADDSDRLEEAAKRFLPRQLQAVETG